ncbi:MAG: FG-GAP-like repeat-containing protein, partial [Actinomycetota bacterium]
MTCLAAAVVASSCGGETADRERNVDAAPPSSTSATGPRYRDLSFTENFTGTTMRAEGTTADWGTESGKLTMAAAPAVREFKFTEQKLTYDPGPSLSDVVAADYDGASEFTSWLGATPLALFRSAVDTVGGQERTVIAVGSPTAAFVIKQDDATLADLNGDGADEMIRLAGTPTPGKGALAIQNANRNLAELETFDDPSVAERVVVGDFTQDGLLDIVTVGKRVTLHAQLRPIGSTLRFATAVSVDLLGVSELQTPIKDVAVGDVNNDGFDDLVLSGPGNLLGENGLTYLLSSAREEDSFRITGVQLPGDLGSVGQVQVVNLDGLPGNELLLNTSARGLMYLPSADIQRNGAGIQIDYPSTYAWYGAAGDVTGDGVTDLAFVDKVGRVYLRIGTRGPGWWRGGGTVVVSSQIVGQNSRSVRVRDVNRDGQNDISVVERFTVRNFIVGSAQSAEAARITDETFIDDAEDFATSTTVEFGDVNRDGRLDVVVCGTLSGNQCHISLHSGSPISPFEQTAPVVVSVVGTVISDAAIGDLSGDGYPELVVVGDKSIRIFNNTRDPVTPYLDVIPTGDSVSRVIKLSTDPAVSVAV